METQLKSQSKLDSLVCSQCKSSYSAAQVSTYSLCCHKPLIPTYHKADLPKSILLGREQSMWRYAEMLPLLDYNNRVTLGEGMTPILKWPVLSDRFGLTNLLIKDEGVNPTGSFKARGIAMAVSKAIELGMDSFVIPTAGNAGVALSAYAAASGRKATVIMPRKTPDYFKEQCEHYGAELILVEGLIDSCGKLAAQMAENRGSFNLSTMKEPYRLEGKKTMGYELAEQLDWQVPDMILYPTGGGTGLIGIWKAFKEMITLGWINGKLPKMIAVQSALCSPIMDRFTGRQPNAAYQMSIANGLSVPSAFGEDMIMQVLRESEGSVMTVTEQEIFSSMNEIGEHESMLISAEGAAVWAATKRLAESKQVDKNTKILILNTGSRCV
ncbi:threonine synthase [Algoriphagus ratkowskyi]|uniref:Threonine synthase n=1 Tax=Algoriphagus ratkowskyi TaxID=57028 RepID=A0A2W7QPQ2_9BACT|nr:threonine synthase [Algoriphagus ratkowskyi]PZX49971.1 threonine synthase [Algoriphagus ratkowskyi]TXD75541.1 threonine synthase [Algoriphagus ratkowskyi]